MLVLYQLIHNAFFPPWVNVTSCHCVLEDCLKDMTCRYNSSHSKYYSIIARHIRPWDGKTSLLSPTQFIFKVRQGVPSSSVHTKIGCTV